MKNFRHFKTRQQAQKYVDSQPSQFGLVIQKKGRKAKPYMVGTRLAFLHYT